MSSLLHSTAPVSSRQFTAFRWIFGSYLAWHYFALVPWAGELFSAQGILGTPGANPFHGRWWNPLFDARFSAFCWMVPTAAGALSILLAVGWHRRPVALLIAILHSMLFTACPLIANPGLPYVGLLLWLCAIIPPGERWRESAQPWHMPSLAFAVAGVLLAAGYTFSGASKLTSPGWLDGTALRTVLATPLARDDALISLLAMVPDGLMKIMTWGTLAFEVAYLPLWLAPRLRTPLWLAAMALHAGILCTLNFADLTLGMVMIHLFVMPPTLMASLSRRSWSLRSQPATRALAADG